ncbi:heavy metal translocating P-type ATPase metal-binding domain-containing protein [Ancylomarina sp. DW003]|nr:heavy metal translocating P-type ATPase metal-binding domain-containing protein [Ancylomarina sp. DW003]MDE5420861.1 heavy metal translocating P-type ATPase metal-binding domain-containing protein [Ancylomarina sp. DW003]
MTKIAEDTKNEACIHCGDDCGKHPVIWDGKPFCCSGCSTVYQLLNENELCSYYNIESTPGIRVEEGKFKEKYAFLDDEEISSKLYEFSEDAIRKVSLYIPGIHCSSCIWLLEHLNVLNKAVLKSTVNFVKKEVTVTFNSEELSLRELAELLASIHYIPEITLDNLQEKKNQDANKKLLYKIGVAGFSFGNIMLLSLPEYVPGSEYLESHFKSFFGMMNFLLVLPVLFYSGNDYIISAFKGLKHKFINIDVPISLGIITLFIQSSFEIFTSTGSGYMDSLTGLIFFLLIGKWYQSKSYQALSFERDYRSYFPVAVSKIVDDKEESTQINKLKKGDIILIRNQELIPADAILTKGEALIDYSFVTGESRSVLKSIGDHLFAGGKQVGGAIEMCIEKEVVQSRLTQLWNQSEDKEIYFSKLNSLIDQISKYFTIIVIAIGALAGFYWLLNDTSKAVFAFTSVLIVACPCALALSSPFALGNTMRMLGRLGIYLKGADIVEALSGIDTIVFDKTGTITQADAVSVKYDGEDLSKEDFDAVKSLARHSSHVLSTILYDHLGNYSAKKVDEFKEMVSLGLTGKIEGRDVKIGSASFVLDSKAENLSGSTEVYVSIDGNVKGRFIMSNQYRTGLNELISSLSSNYGLHVLSGDNDAEKSILAEIFPKNSSLLFNQSPKEKLEYIQALKESGKKILMIGDGLNDAGALKVSDVGISIADDIYHFSPACDAILEASKFQELKRFLSISKKGMWVVKLSFLLSFAYNLVGLYFAVQGILSPIVAALLMPVSSISVVAFASFTTSYFARNKESKEFKNKKEVLPSVGKLSKKRVQLN